jgi:hypothetical protein
MPFILDDVLIGAAIGGGTGILSGIFGGASQRAQANAQNAEAERIAQAQYKRAMQEYNIGKKRDVTQWYWDRARVEQLRFNEKQTAVDQATYGAKLISAATENLAINSQALYDKFVTEERLRGTQVGMEYRYATDKLASESTETLRQYLQQVNQTAAASSQMLLKMNTDTQELMTSLALDEQRDNLGWTLNVLQSLSKDAEAKAATSARQGGSNTSRQMAVQAAKALGRTWAEMEQKSTSRKTKLGLLNSTMTNEISSQLGQYALAMQDDVEKMKFTNTRYISDYGLAKNQMEKLTIPSFQLAENQYGRELKSLQLQTKQAFDEASTKYREQTFFDPLRPVAGLKPKYIAPTAIAGPSTGSIIGNAILSGIQGAAQFSDPKKWFGG